MNFISYYLENLRKSRLELIKVFNLLIITEVKLRKFVAYLNAAKDNEDGVWAPNNKTPHDRTPEPSSDPEMVDADPAIASADPDDDSKP